MKRIFPLLIISGLLLSCSDSALVSENQLLADVNGKAVVYNPNQEFTVVLDVHADGGYQWFKSISDTNIVKLDSTSYRPKGDKNLVGGLTVETSYFRTIKRGSCLIALQEKRGWEKDVRPINIIQFTVEVR